MFRFCGHQFPVVWIPRSILAASYGKTVALWETSEVPSKWLHHFAFSQIMNLSSYCSVSWSAFGVVRFLDFSHSFWLQPWNWKMLASWKEGSYKPRQHIKKQRQHFAAAAAAAAKSLQLCPTLCDPRDGSPPGSPILGILQTRTLEWVAISI